METLIKESRYFIGGKRRDSEVERFTSLAVSCPESSSVSLVVSFHCGYEGKGEEEKMEEERKDAGSTLLTLINDRNEVSARIKSEVVDEQVP